MPTARPSIDVGNAFHLEQLAGAPAEAGGTETGADGSRLGKALLEDLVTAPQFFAGSTRDTLIRSAGH